MRHGKHEAQGAFGGSILRPTALRRVIRRGKSFICGMCRSKYDSPVDANSCISSCWKERKQGSLIELRTHVFRKLWRCVYCHREYGERNQATACAKDCRVHMPILHYSLEDAPDAPPPKRIRFVKRPAFNTAPVLPPYRVHKDESSNQADVSPDIAPAPESAVEVAPLSITAAPPAAK